MTISTRWQRALSVGALTLAMAWAAQPVKAEALSWRQTSVVATSSGGTTLRKGVAILANKEGALMTVNIRALAAPVDGKFPYVSKMDYQFAEGSTLTLEFRGEAWLTPDGRQVPGEFKWTGDVVNGTGRFAGAKGSFKIRIRTGLDPAVDGILGDNFGAVDLDYTVSR